MSKSLYDILGISKSATDSEIKSAYRKLARKMHPDLHPNDKKAAEKFKDITSAYDILSNKDKKAKYDNGLLDEQGNEKAGFSGFRNSDFSGFRKSSSGFGSGFDFSDLFQEDIFSQFTHGGRQRPQPKVNGKNITYNMKISFIDSIKGIEKSASLTNGKNISVKIPAGTIDGQTLRLKGQGTKGMNGGKSGDALITINVTKHKYFESDGTNIILNLPITLKEAILGTKITIPTIDKKVSITIPPYSKTGDTLRLKGKGIITKNKTGDQLVRINIKTPTKKDETLDKFLKNWEDTEQSNIRKNLQ